MFEIHGIKLDEEFECECGKKHKVPIKRVVTKEKGIYSIPNIVDDLDLRGTACIIHDKVTKEIAGNIIMETLAQNDIKVIEFITEGPYESEAKNAYNVLVKNDCKYAIAVGGGSVIDVGKLASHKASIPFISVPTALSHDGIASATASLISEEGVKRSFKAKAPIAVVFDLKILKNSPKRMIIAGCADLLCKATSVKDWELGRDELGEYYCPFIARLTLSSFHENIEFLRRGCEAEAIGEHALTILKSSIAMLLFGSSRPNSGSEHLISHYLDTYYKTRAMHGEQVAIGTILMSKYHSEYNQNWWDQEEFQWYYMKSLLERVGFPMELSRLGIERNWVIEALCKAHELRPERYTILHKRSPSPTEASRLLSDVGF